MNANANANAESPKATRPPSAEFHLIPETLPGFSDATQNLGPGAHATALKPIIVPNGVPHWFSEVSGTFLYYTIKVR